jgi:polyhydroxyalkanoate synthesis regulator phasin
VDKVGSARDAEERDTCEPHLTTVHDHAGARRPEMSTDTTLEMRMARLEEEVDALERQVEALREELRALARMVSETAAPLPGGGPE